MTFEDYKNVYRIGLCYTGIAVFKGDKLIVKCASRAAAQVKILNLAFEARKQAEEKARHNVAETSLDASVLDARGEKAYQQETCYGTSSKENRDGPGRAQARSSGFERPTRTGDDDRAHASHGARRG